MEAANGALADGAAGSKGGGGSGKKEVKVVIVGDGGCGKTSLLMVYAKGAFPEVSLGALLGSFPFPPALPEEPPQGEGLGAGGWAEILRAPGGFGRGEGATGR